MILLLSKALALALTSVMFSLTYLLDSASGLCTEDFIESLVANRENVRCSYNSCGDLIMCSLYSLYSCVLHVFLAISVYSLFNVLSVFLV